MKRILALILGLIASPLFGQTTIQGSGGGVSSGAAVSGCTAFSIVYIDTSGNLACASTPINGSVTTAGRSILTIRDTITGASATSNFLNITGTVPATLSADTEAILLTMTTVNQSQNQTGIHSTLSGNIGAGGLVTAVRGDVAASNSGGYAGGVLGASTGVAAENVGVHGFASGGTGNVGGFFHLSSSTVPSGTAALIADIRNIAANIFEARDNGAARSTTAAAANVTILDGAQVYLGPMGLTSATMTPTIVSEARTVLHSYAWTNAMVVALGATGTGDITVATLPAKTHVRNAYVVIDTPDSSANALTVGCGDAIGGAPFINYTVASDAKAAANTVYGDAVAERGTSLDVEFYYLPSYTATTLVTCRFIKSVTNLNTVTGSTGRVILETALIP